MVIVSIVYTYIWFCYPVFGAFVCRTLISREKLLRMCCEKNLARLPEALRRSCSMASNSRTNWPSEALRCSDPSFWTQSKPHDKRPRLERHEWWQPEFWGMKKFRVPGVLKNQGYTQSWIVWEKSGVLAEYIHSWLWLRYLGKSLQVDSSGSIG